MGGKYKGMALIEEAELERLRQRQIKEYNPSLRSLGQIQEQIEKLFDDPELTDEGKVKILSHLQDRFGILLSQFKNSTSRPSPETEGKPLEIEIKPQNNPNPSIDSEEDPKVEASEETPVISLIPSLEEAKIPSHFASKFQHFQDFLRKHQNEICSNDKKEIVLDGEPIAHSSFPDLLRSLYIRNNEMNLIGSQQFHSKLYELNARSDMFSHKDTLKALSRLDKKSQKHASQTGEGAHPPGKRPRFLHVFR